MKNESLQKQITEEIIQALKQDIKPWVCPWDKPEMKLFAYNLYTDEAYSGINVLILWIKAYKQSHSSNAWMTFKQAQNLKAHVRKGEKGTRCIRYSVLSVEDEDTGDLQEIPFSKSFVVFNADQFDDLDLSNGESKELKQIDAEEGCEALLEATDASLEFGGFRACYNLSDDVITLPRRKNFKTLDDYYATALHELVHWTGHEDRLNRDGINSKQSYAFEELVAELGCAFLCAELGVTGELQHTSYIKSWLKLLESDEKAIFRAASQASKAHKYLMHYLTSATDSNSVKAVAC